MDKNIFVIKLNNTEIRINRDVDGKFIIPDELRKYMGIGTALKPAHEPIVMARKPLSEKTVVDNVVKWGTGGINIDESRIDLVGIEEHSTEAKGGLGNNVYGKYKNEVKTELSEIPRYNTQGRFPANVIFDEEAGKLLDEQSGVTKSGKVTENKSAYEGDSNTGFLRGFSTMENQHGDSGGASRFFYCPKVSKRERNEGLDGFEGKVSRRDDGQPYGMNTNKFRPDGSERKPVQLKKNHHPTVKPVDLLLYLIRLVTPPNGTTLDPFMGSGSSGRAAVRGGFNFIGIEREDEYFQIAEARIEYEKVNPTSKKSTDTTKNKKVEPDVEQTLNKFFE